MDCAIMKCPVCGAPLRVIGNKDYFVCEYCNTPLRMNEEHVLFQVDQAEEMGYRFEKGRQRALSEQQNFEWDNRSGGAYSQPESGYVQMNAERGEYWQGSGAGRNSMGHRNSVRYGGGNPQDAYIPNYMDISDKDRKTALLLCIFLGFFGVHQFYLGNIKKGILYLLTYGLFLIGWIIDIVSLATGSFRDKYGRLVVNLDKPGTTGSPYGDAYVNYQPGDRHGVPVDPEAAMRKNNKTKRTIFLVLAALGVVSIISSLGDGEFSSVLFGLVWSGVFFWLWHKTPEV